MIVVVECSSSLSEKIQRGWVGILELGLGFEGIGGEAGGWNLLPSEVVCSLMNRWFAGCFAVSIAGWCRCLFLLLQ